MIRIAVDGHKLGAALSALKKRTGNLRPFMKDVRDIMREAVEDNFAAQGRPAWRPLAAATIKERARRGYWPGKILQRHSGNAGLLGSIHGAYTDKSALVGTNIRYAAIHQFGGAAGRKSARVHIPARPFLALTESDKQDIVDTAKTYLQEGL
ncbi:MAG: phage virion morphogenesis protein [Elusimicrobiales bacterium]